MFEACVANVATFLSFLDLRLPFEWGCLSGVPRATDWDVAVKFISETLLLLLSLSAFPRSHL